MSLQNMGGAWAVRHGVIQTIAKTLCECDGKDWLRIIPAERDRYARIAILIDDRVQASEPKDAEPDRIGVPLRPPALSAAAN